MNCFFICNIWINIVKDTNLKHTNILTVNRPYGGGRKPKLLLFSSERVKSTNDFCTTFPKKLKTLLISRQLNDITKSE